MSLLGVTKNRWEHGSDFHWVDCDPAESAPVPWSRASFWLSGRDAFRALARQQEWRRIWLPSYYCHHLTQALIQDGFEVRLYPDTPLESRPNFQAFEPSAGDAVVTVNYFGLRAPCSAPAWKGVALVEDHTHDPLGAWADSSSAHWCFASLRKYLPIPAGAALWSPQGMQSPPSLEGADRAAHVASEKTGAMLLKRLYLEGHEIDKEEFRAVFGKAEAGLALGQPASLPRWIEVLALSMPHRPWQQERRDNFAAFVAAIEPLGGISVLEPEAGSVTAFSVPIVLETPAMAKRVKDKLLSDRVYPAQLWDLSVGALDGIPDDHTALSRRILSIACDMRYDENHMREVAARFTRALGN